MSDFKGKEGILEEFFRILSPARLPISPLRQLTYFNALGDNFQSLDSNHLKYNRKVIIKEILNDLIGNFYNNFNY